MRIDYLTESPVKKYAKDLNAATTLDELLTLLKWWDDVAPDALQAAAKMQPSDFLDFRAGLRKERRGEFAGDEWYRRFAAIMMPERMFLASAVEQQYHIPWGTAYIRLRDTGRFKKPRKDSQRADSSPSHPVGLQEEK